MGYINLQGSIQTTGFTGSRGRTNCGGANFSKDNYD